MSSSCLAQIESHSCDDISCLLLSSRRLYIPSRAAHELLSVACAFAAWLAMAAGMPGRFTMLSMISHAALAWPRTHSTLPPSSRLPPPQPSPPAPPPPHSPPHHPP